MKSIHLGTDLETNQKVWIPKSVFSTHFHFIGGTGKGKTTAIHTLLRQLLRDPSDNSACFVIDRLGNLCQELLLWMASDQFCTDRVRNRLIYIQPSREDVVFAFNPLLYETMAHGYYKVERATEIVLRAWESVNIEAMPRLARWTFNSFWAAAQLGLTIADCVHFLMPGSDFHTSLLNVLPQRLKAEWEDINNPRSQSEAVRILESSRNRLKPYFESDILRRMFGSTENRMNIAEFMRDGKIVLIDLAPRNRLASQLANTIGALMLNEIIATSRNLPLGQRYPAYIFLDEFQNFVGPDLEQALPEVRQLGLRFLLSHQSFSQLKRGDYDLTSMIFQAQSRLLFGVQGEDADILAQELAAIMYDPDRIKDELYTRRQLNAGHTLVELSSWSDAEAESKQWKKDFGSNWSEGNSRARRYADPLDSALHTSNTSRGSSERTGEGSGQTSTHTRGGHQTLLPEYRDFDELSTRSYRSSEEQRSIWARDVRNLPTGHALMRLVDEPKLHHVKVKRSAPGYLRYNLDTIATKFPAVIDRMEELLEHNFQSDIFRSAADIDREAEERLRAVCQRKIVLQSNADPKQVNENEGDSAPSSHPFS